MANFELSGRLGGEPKLLASKGGDICNISLAVDGQNSKGDKMVFWFDIACFGKLARDCKATLHKGMTVKCSGYPREERYVGKDKKEVVKLGMKAFEVVQTVVRYVGVGEQ